ncbi:open rectifier potassium channel protein 1 isoform X1 [Diorhabda sublineata]|uniref:open rectifier potassium channel protein 1 isoform X1 n=2 Tax=Diorhabda sublineata TaxID=1163346 RepID=UPI0024E04DBE|nr:open rectifier potassium channel protein 1 isoform X1 [Diorhabda sublineata]
MMSKKQWFVLLCLFILYLLLGASIFFYIESQEEVIKQKFDIRERQYIEELLRSNYQGNNKSIENLFRRLTDYCGKPVHYHMSDDTPDYKWNYYNSIFFVITVVSTIGYGNLSPTTMFTRIFIIFYGLIGIPMNGIVMVTLGDFFGKSFTKLYERWKKLRLEKNTAKLGLIGQIILYAVPGLTFFIFLPSTIISFFEGWSYDVAVYYAFVTLTTIGFGDYVAGTQNIHNFHPWVFVSYHLFLLVWVIGGLGYVIMIIGFITKGMKSRKIAQIEKLLAQKVKQTPLKIQKELRSMLHELLFMRVKPVYKGEFEYTPKYLERSQSCPTLTIWINNESPTMARKRAMSECYRYNVLDRIQSESELDKIDKERTFRPSDAFKKQKDLLLRVVDALSLASTSSKSDRGVHGFSDNEILASERSISHTPVHRRRAVSDVKPPGLHFDDDYTNTWYGSDASRALKAFKRKRAMSFVPMPASKKEKSSLIYRIQNVSNRFKTVDMDENDIEKQILDEPINTIFNPNHVSSNSNSIDNIDQNVLEQTSIAEFIRALNAITIDEDTDPKPKRKIGIASLTPPKYSPIFKPPNYRRNSLVPPSRISAKPRRFSMTPVDEHILSSPPPYTPISSATNSSTVYNISEGRRFSVRPTPSSYNFSPVKIQVNKRKFSKHEKGSYD